jgi:hypothetical protein
MALEDRLRPKAPLRGEDRIIMTFSIPGSSPLAKAAEADRKRREEERAEVMSVALRQPHRGGSHNEPGSDDPKLSTALGRFCANFKPRPLGSHCYRAGSKYGEIIGEARTAQGFSVPGWEPGDRGYWETCSKPNCDKRDPRSPICLCAAQARKELALMRLKEANALLTSIIAGMPWQMCRLCFDSIDPSPQEYAWLQKGLVKLSDEWGFSPKSDMRD